MNHFEHIPEILAPAGGVPQFFAALNTGADAVFLGLKSFNARARAANFTMDELRALMPLARAHGMKVLVTLNILVKEEELAQVVTTLNDLADLGVDAIIVQDLAVARIARTYFPTLRLHASTQMAIHNLAGVLQAVEWGFKRVVIAREMTAAELRRIRAAVPREVMEIEAFSHGSLCYSYSGLCFFSGAADARSGNRGECSYTCRQSYRILNDESSIRQGFLFSMRDLDTAEDLDKLINAGVDTLKIEGRKKDEQYVAATVQHYRRRLDKLMGRSTLRLKAPAEAHALYSGREGNSEAAAGRSDLELSFHRRTTSFFLGGRYQENVIDLDNPTHLGVRVGVIEAVNRSPSRITIKVKAETPLERFDGLRILNKLDFGLREMSVLSERVAVAKSGSWVTITLPEGREKDVATVKSGDLLFKMRSADLKRRVEALSSPPIGSRIRPAVPVDVVIELQASDKVRVNVAIRRFGEVLVSAHAIVDAMPARSPRFAADCREVFSVFGDEGFAAESISVEESLWFVPQKILKQLKREISPRLLAAYQELSSRRLQSAICGTQAHTQTLSGITSPRFAIKIDRLEYLDALTEFMASAPEFTLAEVVYEPKRAFLGDRKPADITAALAAFRMKTGCAIRFAIPTVVRAWDEPLLELHLTAVAEAGICGFEAGNPGALYQIRDWSRRGLVGAEPASDITTDFTAFALNHMAAAQWADDGARLITLSIEDDRANLMGILRHWPSAGQSGPRPQLILFKDTPLFIAESCSLTALHGGCPGAETCGYRTLHIENEKGERFYAAHEGCKSIVYGETSYSIVQNIDEMLQAGVADFRIDFLTRPYTHQRILEVLDAVRQKLPVPETHSANFAGRLL